MWWRELKVGVERGWRGREGGEAVRVLRGICRGSVSDE